MIFNLIFYVNLYRIILNNELKRVGMVFYLIVDKSLPYLIFKISFL